MRIRGDVDEREEEDGLLDKEDEDENEKEATSRMSATVGDTNGIFGHISRAHHAWVPDAGWRWDKVSGSMLKCVTPQWILTDHLLVLLAFYDFKHQEEITVAYRDPALLSSERRNA